MLWLYRCSVFIVLCFIWQDFAEHFYIDFYNNLFINYFFFRFSVWDHSSWVIFCFFWFGNMVKSWILFAVGGETERIFGNRLLFYISDSFFFLYFTYKFIHLLINTISFTVLIYSFLLLLVQ